MPGIATCICRQVGHFGIRPIRRRRVISRRATKGRAITARKLQGGVTVKAGWHLRLGIIAFITGHLLWRTWIRCSLIGGASIIIIGFRISIRACIVQSLPSERYRCSMMSLQFLNTEPSNSMHYHGWIWKHRPAWGCPILRPAACI